MQALGTRQIPDLEMVMRDEGGGVFEGHGAREMIAGNDQDWDKDY